MTARLNILALPHGKAATGLAPNQPRRLRCLPRPAWPIHTDRMTKLEFLSNPA